jgi:hypothetical protein
MFPLFKSQETSEPKKVAQTASLRRFLYRTLIEAAATLERAWA